MAQIVSRPTGTVRIRRVQSLKTECSNRAMAEKKKHKKMA